jgi:DNA-binding LytR/AlgR family response regulator
MIRILAIDDEPLALRLLEVYCTKLPQLRLLATCTSTQQAQPWIEQADALLVDINMPDVNGLDFVRSLEEPPLIIFTTAYAEYAVEGFRVNAVDYLLKPFSFNEFKTSIQRLEERLAARRSNSPAEDGFLTLATAHRNIRLEMNRIRYIEGMGEYLKIHLDGEDAPVIVLYRMKNIADELPQDRFMRIHRSYIIALDRVREAQRHQVTLDDKTKLPVGESYRESWWKKISSD